ncbi:MAG: aminoacetone oxidase family FAD-binding enzyme [Clostridiales bacterium]|nr:aminoacetone oxidase family FAD-binding enzyme [Clostridiales bacterium]
MGGSKMKAGIIGGGAAGLFAACHLKRLLGDKDLDVTLIEKNPVPGKKLTLTGHGRCNITNRKDPSMLKNCYHEAGNFIYPALKEFGPEDTIRFFENDLGLKTKEEDNNRIFPVCDSAVTVRDTLVSYISDRVKIISGANVLDIKKGDVFEVNTSKGRFEFDIVILSSGGSSFPKTGSVGDSYNFLESFGHTIISPRGALAPVKAGKYSAELTKALSGVSLEAKVFLYLSDKLSASAKGEILFADFGLTGPAVMEIAREIPADVEGSNACLELDLIPSMSDEEFDRELIGLIGDHPDTKITNLIARYIPASVAGEISARAGFADIYAQGFPKESRRSLLREIKHLKIDIAEAPSMDKAYVTRGGVSLKEVDRKTMQSKLVPGLYITGEALDVDGISGGFNLQACMSEAYLAAKSILSMQ